ncbi:unnamed protein product [Diabrotica balteata]|uniref:Pre-piRNA 3'-exonuclease trimmer-like n=1 Tax=Diabrotica balteata TaxID=107213 RepID=A0A9P0E335_DIABA|nr:unnamed protein product [Diabrotica balteata]
MTEINNKNFEENFPEIKKALDQAKFVSVDLEFSALYPLKEYSPSLFDTPKERYQKIRKNVQLVVPIQVGLTAFSFNPDTNSYLGTIYNFYIIPASFPFIRKNCLFQSDTLSFLKFFEFDFNKFVYSGIPYINKDEEQELRQRFKNNDITDVQSLFRQELQNIFHDQGEKIRNWYATANIGETLAIPEFYQVSKDSDEFVYFIHKTIRDRFKNVWTSVKNNEFVLKKVTSEEFKKLHQLYNLEEECIKNLLGFSRVFRYLVSLQKPLIGHNLMQDLLLMIECFEKSLPPSYESFKKTVNTLFPKIFDTKSILYNIKKNVPEDKKIDDKSLKDTFEYFKDGIGRHLALNSPAIENNCNGTYNKYHEAGWDSFCAGYIFIRMAYFNLYQQYPKSKRYMSGELIAGLEFCQNKVNVIRGAVSSIQLDGEDPASTRPPYLVVESLKNAPINIHQVSSVLSSFGFVEIRKFPYQNKRALIAVDNFGSARRILQNFKSSKEYQVRQYSALKHSPVIRACLLSGVTISGVILLWITHSALKK